MKVLTSNNCNFTAVQCYGKHDLEFLPVHHVHCTCTLILNPTNNTQLLFVEVHLYLHLAPGVSQLYSMTPAC